MEVNESLAQSEVEVIEHLLYKQSPEDHLIESEEERWYIELGERPAFLLSYERLGDGVRFLINTIWPYLYRVDPDFQAMAEWRTQPNVEERLKRLEAEIQALKPDTPTPQEADNG